ncbi:hypothetical protein HOJ01_03520 [bacterium]|jgi:hypothetical protein|nr:hypothetical protein [bacterium]MBT6293851.1 hypothetical protein [bacterium]
MLNRKNKIIFNDFLEKRLIFFNNLEGSEYSSSESDEQTSTPDDNQSIESSIEAETQLTLAGTSPIEFLKLYNVVPEEHDASPAQILAVRNLINEEIMPLSRFGRMASSGRIHIEPSSQRVTFDDLPTMNDRLTYFDLSILLSRVLTGQTLNSNSLIIDSSLIKGLVAFCQSPNYGLLKEIFNDKTHNELHDMYMILISNWLDENRSPNRSMNRYPDIVFDSLIDKFIQRRLANELAEKEAVEQITSRANRISYMFQRLLNYDADGYHTPDDSRSFTPKEELFRSIPLDSFALDDSIVVNDSEIWFGEICLKSDTVRTYTNIIIDETKIDHHEILIVWNRFGPFNPCFHVVKRNGVWVKGESNTI